MSLTGSGVNKCPFAAPLIQSESSFLPPPPPKKKSQVWGDLLDSVFFLLHTVFFFGGGGGTMGCHPMLTKNTNFVTNALRGDLSTVNVRP